MILRRIVATRSRRVGLVAALLVLVVVALVAFGAGILGGELGADYDAQAFKTDDLIVTNTATVGGLSTLTGGFSAGAPSSAVMSGREDAFNSPLYVQDTATAATTSALGVFQSGAQGTYNLAATDVVGVTGFTHVKRSSAGSAGDDLEAWGVWGIANSGDSTGSNTDANYAIGVRGEAGQGSAGSWTQYIGVQGTVSSGSGTVGSFTGKDAEGVLGSISGAVGSAGAAGVVGTAAHITSSTGNTYGVYGRSRAGDANSWGVYSDGPFGFNATQIGSTASSAEIIGNAAASATVPTLIPNQSSTTTGIGAQASGNLSIIVGGTEEARSTSNNTTYFEAFNVIPATDQSPVNVSNSHSARTVSITGYQATLTGSSDTTGGSITNTGISATVTSTRSAGATSLNNTAAIFSASGAQNNDALYCDAGDVLFNQTSGAAYFNGQVNVRGAGVKLLGDQTSSYQLTNSGASSTVPTLVPNKASTNSGVGADTSGDVSLIAGGAEELRCTGNGCTFITTKNRGTITLSGGTGTATTFSGAVCVCTDTTATNVVKCAVSSTTLTATGTGTDVVAYHCL